MFKWKADDLYGVVGNLMRKPRTKDDYWYTKITNAEPKKIYRYCPRCNAKVGIPEIYKTKFCFMCGEIIYANEEENEKARKKIMFTRNLEKRGVKLNVKNKRNIRRKKIQKEI